MIDILSVIDLNGLLDASKLTNFIKSLFLAGYSVI